VEFSGPQQMRLVQLFDRGGGLYEVQYIASSVGLYYITIYLEVSWGVGCVGQGRGIRNLELEGPTSLVQLHWRCELGGREQGGKGVVVAAT
jgi:hypothetical protein